MPRYGNKCPTIDEWIKNIYTHTHTHILYMIFSFIMEILLFVKTWMDLEDVFLNEIGQTQKDKYFIISLT